MKLVIQIEDDKGEALMRVEVPFTYLSEELIKMLNGDEENGQNGGNLRAWGDKSQNC